jgi:hypothetical protein
MKKSYIVFLFLFCMVSCTNNSQRITWFPKFESEKMSHRKGFYFIKGLKAYQQTTEYTCGPAALLALARFYGLPGIGEDKETEMKIAREAGTRSADIPKEEGKPGTKPEEMGRWLEQHGFDVRTEFEDKEDGSALEKLKENIRKGIPTLVEWADLTGHWVIAVGYDDRGNDDPYDDVLIFADSYDKYDDYRDGYSFVNANRFYWLWFDVFYFDKITWRTMITAIPESLRQN